MNVACRKLRAHPSGLPTSVRGVLRSVEVVGAEYGVGDARDDVFLADMPFEFGLLHELRRLFSCAAKQECAARGMNFVGQFADCAETCSVYRGHVAQTKNDNGGKLFHSAQNFIKFIGAAKKKWAVNAINSGVRRNVFSLQNVHTTVFDIVARDSRNACRTRNFADESERGENHSNFHGKRKICDYG